MSRSVSLLIDKMGIITPSTLVLHIKLLRGGLDEISQRTYMHICPVYGHRQ